MIFEKMIYIIQYSKEKYSKMKKTAAICSSPYSFYYQNQTARVTFPDLRQRVQTYTDFDVPLTTALTLRILGFQVLFERLCEWLTLIPKETPLPQISHFAT